MLRRLPAIGPAHQPREPASPAARHRPDRRMQSMPRRWRCALSRANAGSFWLRLNVAHRRRRCIGRGPSQGRTPSGSLSCCRATHRPGRAASRRRAFARSDCRVGPRGIARHCGLKAESRHSVVQTLLIRDPVVRCRHCCRAYAEVTLLRLTASVACRDVPLSQQDLRKRWPGGPCLRPPRLFARWVTDRVVTVECQAA